MANLTEKERQILREKCKTDLFFLAKAVLHKALTEKTHRPITDFFVKKHSHGLPPNYTQQQMQDYIGTLDIVHERLLMYPRGSFKSTIDGIDVVQWIINFPDIRIFLMTGNFNLAESFMLEIKEYFTLNENAEPTQFQVLFPEFCISAKQSGKADEYRCPAAHLGLKEPTVWINSVDAATSGWHCDIMKCDDVVTDKNAETDTRRASVIATFDKKRYLVDQPFGYIDVIGTRYARDDLYGRMLERNDQSDDKDLKYLHGAAWYVKPQGLHKKIHDLRIDDVDLLFPERLTFKVLRNDLLNNEMEFRCQRLNEPAFGTVDIFDIDSLNAAIRPPQFFPESGDIYICWDTAHTVNDHSNNSCAAVIKKDAQDRLFLIDIICEKLKTDELAYKIAQLCQMWSPKTVIIEKYNGYQGLMLEIQRNAMGMHIPLNIDWFDADNHLDAKLNRVKNLQPLIKTGRFFFCSTIPIMDQVFKQFLSFTGKKGRADDIPDAISFILRTLPESLSYRELTEKEKAMQEKAKKDDMYERLFPDRPVVEDPGPTMEQSVYDWLDGREI